MEIGGVAIEVVRKDIKSLRLRVLPQGGHVRLSVPRRVDAETLRRFVTARLDWIRRERARFAAQAGESELELISGEMHLVQGRRCRLEVTERAGPASVRLAKNGTLLMSVRPGTSGARRAALLGQWYKELLRAELPQLIARWEARIGVKVVEWRIKKMTTRWGTCNPRAQRIWLNLELAKRPAACLEFIVVHEMVHMLERLHNARFRGLMDRFLPKWRQRHEELNQA